jgi:amino-acid N-acetyltransferase
MPLRAEPARPHDVPEALDLLKRSGLPDHDVAERFGHYFVVREDDARVVGLAGLEIHGEDGLLRSVAVESGYRSQGLGRALVEAALERARQLGLGSVYLLTTTARDFFLHLGFEGYPRDEAPGPIRASWEFRAGCPATAILMRKTETAGQAPAG